MADEVLEQDLAAYLTGKGIQVFRAKGAEITAQCWNCGETHKKGKLYLNTESWLASCKVCQYAANRRTLLENFGDEDGLRHEGLDPGKKMRMLREVVEVAHDMLLGNETQVNYLVDRGIAPEVILREKIGYVPRNVGITDMIPGRQDPDWQKRLYTNADLLAAGLVTPGGREALNHSIVIPYWSHGAVVQLRAKDVGGKYRTMGGDNAKVYNADALQTAIDVVAVEGELDTLALRFILDNAGDRKLAATSVVGVPGAGSWPDGFVDMLAQVDGRVYVGFDPDETGKMFAAKLKGELGTKARIVELPDSVPEPDWSDLFSAKTPKNPHGGKTWTDVRDLFAEADLLGKRLFSVADAGLKWARQHAEQPGLKLGFPTIDAILRPGLKPGQVFLPMGSTGAGKTVLLSNLAHNLRHYGVLYISLEMTASEVFEHFRRIHKFWSPKATYEEMLLDYHLVHITEENRLRSGDFHSYIQEYIDALGQRPRVVIVDYLQYFARGFRGASMYERATDAIMEIKAVSKEEAISAIVPSQVGRTGKPGQPLDLNSARDAGTIEETADFVFSFWRPDMAINPDPTVTPPAQSSNMMAQLLKSRNGGVGRTFNLKFSPMSLAIVDPLDRRMAMKVDSENGLSRAGMHYDEYRQQQQDEHAQDALVLPTGEEVGPRAPA